MNEIVINNFKVGWTQRADGNFAREAEGVEARRRSLVDRDWSWLNQVHGGEVVVVSAHDQVKGADGDSMVSTNPDALLSVTTADCVPIAAVGDNGVFAAVHAGWRGIVSGVVENAAAKMREKGAVDIIAAAGPCIGPECFEFAPDELFEISEQLGAEIIGTTSWDTPSMDLRAAVASKCKIANVDLQYISTDCTSCMTDDYFSARAREEVERMAMAIWRPN
jgi:YfiH family protein